MTDPTYAEQISQEAEFWNRAFERQTTETPPDWQHMRHWRHNAVFHTHHFDALLERIKPGMKTLELGCGSGYLTIAAARRGASALGVDIADRAIAIAQTYHQTIRKELPGSAEFRLADLNTIDLPDSYYDIIFTKGVLHHLPSADQLVERVYRALKAGGLFWISDTHSEPSASAVLLAGVLFLALPTRTTYREKLKALRRFKHASPARLRASIQAEGLSPFEGKALRSPWLLRTRELSEIERTLPHPSVTGYLASQIDAPDRCAMPFLHMLRAVEDFLLRINAVRPNAATCFARKSQGHRTSA